MIASISDDRMFDGEYGLLLVLLFPEISKAKTTFRTGKTRTKMMVRLPSILPED